MRWQWITCFVAATLLQACSLTPLPLRGDFADVAPAQAAEAPFQGLSVRWGGIVTRALFADNENCLEIRAYPIDTWSFRPKVMRAEYSHSGLSEPVQHAFIGRRPPTLFLACSDRETSKDTYFVGSVVTVTGVIESAKIYQIAGADCPPRVVGPKTSDRSAELEITNAVYGTRRPANADEACVVARPALRLRAIHVWREPPTFNPNSPQMGSSP